MSKATSQRGAAVVEFAVLALLLLVFVFGIIEFGLIWLQSHYIANAAREGSRVASKIADVNPSDPPSLNNATEVQTAVEDTVKEYLSGAVVYSDTKVQECCNAGDFIHVPTPVVAAIAGTDNYTLKVTLTVRTADIWEPVLWALLDLLPGSNVGEIRQVTETAVFPIIDS